MFCKEDINPAWFTGPLTPKNRKIVKPMRALGGGRFSVFAKIEIGSYKRTFKILLKKKVFVAVGEGKKNIY